MKRKKYFFAFFLCFMFFSAISCNLIFTSSLGKFASRKKIKDTGVKSVSQLLKEAKTQNVIYNYTYSRNLIEKLSDRSATELFSLNNEEKDLLLNIAVSGTTNIGKIFEVITESFNQDSKKLELESKEARIKLLKNFNTRINIKAVSTILSDKKYLETGSLDSIIFGMCILLSNAAGVVGYDLAEDALNSGHSEKIPDFITKANIETIIYSYRIIYKRPDLDTIEFGGVKIKNLLPSIKI